MSSKPIGNKPTIYDVAKYASVSTSTVSRYLNHKGNVAPKSIQRIENAIEALHYIPDNSAHRLATGSAVSIGVDISEISIVSDYTMGILEGVTSVLDPRNITVTLLHTQGRGSDYYINMVNSGAIGGIIFTVRPENQSGLINRLQVQKIPYVYIGKKGIGEKENIHNVYGGFFEYTNDVLKMMAENGCRNVLFIFQSASQYQHFSENIQNEKLNQYHIKCQFIYCDDNDVSWLWNDLRRRMKEDRPDGIFYMNVDHTAMIFTVLHECGLDVNDIKLATVVHSKRLDSYLNGISKVYVNSNQMGICAGMKIYAMIEGIKLGNQYDVVPYVIL